MLCLVKQSVGRGIRPDRYALGGYLTLEYLEVLQVRVLGINVELDPRHWDVEIDAVEDLAESGAVFHGISIMLRGVTEG
jgi:hypothetical protein